MTGRRRTRGTLLTSLFIVVSLTLGGTAFGYWKAGGAGTASGGTATNAPVTLTPGTPTTALYPGGQANVLLSVSNPNSSPVRIGSLSLDTGQGTGGFAVDGGHSECAVSTLGFTAQTNAGAGWTVAAKAGAVNGTLAITLTNPLAMSTGAAQACQGAAITVYLTAGP